MSKNLTISSRWKLWAEKEPIWAYSALFCFIGAMLGLGLHLGVLSGFLRTAGFWILIAGDIGALVITYFRKQLWWFSFFCYITFGVIGWEIASYFFGN